MKTFDSPHENKTKASGVSHKDIRLDEPPSLLCWSSNNAASRTAPERVNIVGQKARVRGLRRHLLGLLVGFRDRPDSAFGVDLSIVADMGRVHKGFICVQSS